MRRIGIIAACFALSLSSTIKGGDLQYQPAPINNPLKGLIADGGAIDEQFPHSLEYIKISMAEVMKGQDEFDWTALDKRIEAIGSLGRQGIVRPYIDWPGQRTGLPQFLIEAGVRTNGLPRWRRDSAVGEINPNYDDPILRTAIESFIERFGRRYDGRPEIAFIEAGLLGEWGEWLPWNESPVSEDAKTSTLKAYNKSFHRTKILVRLPSMESLRSGFGAHDDWFSGGVINEGVVKLNESELGDVVWKAAPCGARIFPDLQRKLWRSNPQAKLDAAFLKGICASHLSYLRIGTSFANAQEFGFTADLRDISQKLGYEFYVTRSEIASQSGMEFQVNVTITNTGCAPFFYPWPVEIGLAKNAAIKFQTRTDWDIRKIVPSENAMQLKTTIATRNLEKGNYDILLKISNPLPGGPPVMFANVEQNATIPGWVTVGTVSVAD